MLLLRAFVCVNVINALLLAISSEGTSYSCSQCACVLAIFSVTAIWADMCLTLSGLQAVVHIQSAVCMPAHKGLVHATGVCHSRSVQAHQHL